MIISGGVNIYPAEIEAELHRMPGVADCAVFGIPNEEYGEAVCAVVQPQPGVESVGRRREGVSDADAWPATRCPAGSNSSPNCRAKIPARSSSASCANPIGRGWIGGYEKLTFSSFVVGCRERP